MTDPTVQEELLRAPDVEAATGASYRQLDYWARAGYIQPSDVLRSSHRHAVPLTGQTTPETPGTGRVRLWHPDEVEVIRRMVALIQAGLLVDVAARAARETGPVDLGAGITLTAPWATT